MVVDKPRALSLPDGRSMAVHTFGDPDGFVVIDCHGGLVSGRDVAPADSAARDLGIRLVAPNRPGVGRSDRRPGRSIADWPTDVAHVCDALGIDRFGVLGWSMGGQYALACGARLADRVTAVACVAGCAPLDDAATLAELDAMDRRFTWMVRRVPWAAHATFASMHAAAVLVPGAFARVGAHSLTPPDRPQILSDVRWFAGMTAEGLAQPAGMVEEYLTFATPWGFDLADIGVPVHVWQGTEDHYVPAHWAKLIAAPIPDAHVHIVEGAGHFVAYDRWPEVLAPLLP